MNEEKSDSSEDSGCLGDSGYKGGIRRNLWLEDTSGYKGGISRNLWVEDTVSESSSEETFGRGRSRIRYSRSRSRERRCRNKTRSEVERRRDGYDESEIFPGGFRIPLDDYIRNSARREERESIRSVSDRRSRSNHRRGHESTKSRRDQRRWDRSTTSEEEIDWNSESVSSEESIGEKDYGRRSYKKKRLRWQQVVLREEDSGIGSVRSAFFEEGSREQDWSDQAGEMFRRGKLDGDHKYCFDPIYYKL